MKKYEKTILNSLIISSITIVFVLICNSVNAQMYQPLPDSNAIWSVSNIKFGVVGDTVINTKTYKKYYFHYEASNFTFNIVNAHYISALREENKKVFVIPKDSTNELLIYDFGVNQGDTITHCSFNPFLIYLGNSIYFYKSIIDSVDSILIDNIYRRRYKLINNNPFQIPLTEYWIEGMGSTAGLFFPGFYNHFVPDGPLHKLVCLSLNQTIIYQPNPGLNCFDLTWAGIKQLNNEPFINLSAFPNPFHDYCLINIKGKLNTQKSYFLEIYSSNGKFIKKINIYENLVINLNRESLKNGIYYCILKDNYNNLITNQKIIIL